MGVFLNVIFLVITAQPLASPDVLEPSVANEVEHALNRAPKDKLGDPLTAAERDFAQFCATNGQNTTQRAIFLVSTQRKDGRWYWHGTNVTAVAVLQLLHAF